MGLFDIFRRRKEATNGNIKPQQHTVQQPAQYQRALQFNVEFAELLGGDSFIARSDYKHFISEYQEEYKFFCSIVEANILGDYVSKTNLDLAQIEAFINHYDEIKEYDDAGRLVEYRVTNIADLTAEYTNIENLKDGTVLWNDALVVSYSYNDDGTLAYREYNHNLYLFGSNTGTLETWFDEKGRPIYEQAYITHGTLNWFYIYEDEDEIPEYILYEDNNGGQAEFTMYR